MVLKQQPIHFKGNFFIIYVGFNVAKDKHDCFITNSDREVLFKIFSIANSLYAFSVFIKKFHYRRHNKSKMELKDTRHYSYNLFGHLIDKGLLITNQCSLMEHTHICRNVVLDIYAIPYIMLPKSWFELFTILIKSTRNTSKLLKFS